MIDKNALLNVELTLEEYEQIRKELGLKIEPTLAFINKGTTWVVKIVEW